MGRKARINIADIRPLYESGLSTYKIAEKLCMNQAGVYRKIKEWNKKNPDDQIVCRNHVEAQLKHIELDGHQRVGETQSEDSKKAISGRLRNFYESSDGKVAKKKIGDARKNFWDSLPDTEKNEIISDLRVANREQVKSGQGSKFENFIAEELAIVGFAVEQRSRKCVIGKFEVDIVLREEALAIEIDGPTHWEDIYGAQKLASVKAKDKIKDDELTNLGWDILRVQDKTGSCTRARFDRVLEKVREIIKDRKSNNRKLGRHWAIRP